jgi:hypothetical protein
VPRKTQRITVTAEGRDKGKTFLLTELPADQAEAWALRALLGLQRSGFEVTDDTLAGGAASLAAFGLKALFNLPWDELQPLLDEMFSCVQYLHNPKHPAQEIVAGLNSQIEEVATRFMLRIAIFELHLGFSVPDVTPTSGQDSGAADGEGSSTPTFLGSLANWFHTSLRRS